MGIERPCSRVSLCSLRSLRLNQSGCGSAALWLPRRGGFTRRAFTLIELLVVVGVIVLMTGLAVPAFNAIRGGSDFSSEIYDMAGTLDQARSYAMANNTFVLVGIMEVTASQGGNAAPQLSGIGRIAMAVVASRDGSRPYQGLLNTDPAGFQNDWVQTADYNSGKAFIPVTKLATFQNIHIVDLQASTPPLPTTGGMVRPAVQDYDDVGNTVACVSGISLAWPLGSVFNGSPSPQYAFYAGAKVVTPWTIIEFDPQGSARIINTQGPNGPLLDAIPQQIEIGLVQTHGIAVPYIANQTSGQIAAIQIDGMSGSVHMYRP